MLQKRIITAIFLALGLGSAIIWLPPLALVALFGLFVFIGLWEWGRLAGLSGPVALGGYLLIGAVLLGATLWYIDLPAGSLDPDHTRDVVGLGCLWWALALLWVTSYPASVAVWGSRLVTALMGFVILLPAWVGLAYLLLSAPTAGLLLVLLGMVACADVGAFFAGRAIGKRKLAPNVSPGKTWAGFWGGQATSLLFVTGVWWQFGVAGLSLQQLIPISAACVAASVLGDLTVSMAKRHRGVKDSSALLPGHGGVMDRLDSVSAASPAFALALLLVGG